MPWEREGSPLGGLPPLEALEARALPRRPALVVGLAALSGAVLGPAFSGLCAWGQAPRVGPALLALLALGLLVGARSLNSEGRRRGLSLLAAGLFFVALAAEPPPPVLAAGPFEGRGEVLETRAQRFGRASVLRLEGSTLRVVVQGRERLRPGSRVRVVGYGSPPRSWQRGRYAARGWSGDVRAEALEVERLGRGWRALQHAGQEAVDRALQRGAATNADLLSAVTLGRALHNEKRRAFVRSGAAHLLSLSGLHVGLIAAFALWGLRILGHRPKAQRVGAVLATLAFVALVGFRPPTLRAAAAAATFLLFPGRGDTWNRLGAALIAVLLVDPGAPREVGFQLSFGTVAGLIALGRAVAPLRGWRRVAAGACAPFVASTPLIAGLLGQVPWVALALSPVVVPLFGVLLGFTVAGAALGVLHPWLGAAPLWLADQSASALLWLVEAAAQVAPAQLVRPPRAPSVVACAGLLALGIARRERGARSGWWFVAGGLIALSWCLPGPPVARVPEGASELRVYASRERPRSILVSSPEGAAIVGRAPSDRWVKDALAASGTPSLRPGGLRTIELPGGSLVCSAGQRVLWVREAERLRSLALPAAACVATPRRQPKRAAREVLQRVGALRVIGPLVEPPRRRR